MVKCYQHIGDTSTEWCWKCQELTNNERFNSTKTINEIQPEQVAEIIELFKQEDIINKKAKEFDLSNGVYAFEQGVKWQIDRSCEHNYILTTELGHRVIKCLKCNKTQPI
jgi:Asp-tRNA(Asn)/Glu-tRNA(Gln) amidotransferase B subunit